MAAQGSGQTRSGELRQNPTSRPHSMASGGFNDDGSILTGVVAEVVAVLDRLVVHLHQALLEGKGHTRDLGRAVKNNDGGSDSRTEHEEGRETEEELVEEARSPGGEAVLALTVELPLRVALVDC